MKTTFKRIQKPGEPRQRHKHRRLEPCAHIRPRRCCMSCRQFYIDHHGDEKKGLQRFNESLDAWKRRTPTRSPGALFEFA